MTATHDYITIFIKIVCWTFIKILAPLQSWYNYSKVIYNGSSHWTQEFVLVEFNLEGYCINLVLKFSTIYYSIVPSDHNIIDLDIYFLIKKRTQNICNQQNIQNKA